MTDIHDSTDAEVAGMRLERLGTVRHDGRARHITALTGTPRLGDRLEVWQVTDESTGWKLRFTRKAPRSGELCTAGEPDCLCAVGGS